MNLVSRTITGVLMIILGIFLIVLTFFIEEGVWVSFLYGVIILIIGLFIFFNKKEDKIEKIKRRK
ncbi:hypothetical protein ACFLZJ_00240 [Nanoarchaeota archaeon]